MWSEREARAARDDDADAMPNALPEALRGAVDALRAEVPPPAGWRADVLRAVAAEGPARRVDPRVRHAEARWRVRPLAAVAAALLCMAVGASATWWAMRGDTTHDVPRAATMAAASEASASPGLAVPASLGAGGRTVVRFALVAPGAARVTLVGDFNQWNPSATPLRAAGDGRTWVASVPLPPGRHVYAFVVDGGLTADPRAPRAGDEDFDAPSSVVLVGES